MNIPKVQSGNAALDSLPSDAERYVADLDRDGLAILPQVFSQAEVSGLLADLAAAVAGENSESAEQPSGVGQASAPARRAATLFSSGGALYAARNVLQWWPAAREIWRRSPLTALLAAALSSDYGLVRALFFDKPPDRSWALPWHKDLTIAVANNRLPSTHFSHPTTKAGVAHVEAPAWLLERMLTLRIHLDPVTDENGPLQVIAGSHRNGKAAAASAEDPRSILVAAGDVLAMRPLVSHASGHSAAGTTRHRRILHLEFAAAAELPDGYQWQTYLRPGAHE